MSMKFLAHFNLLHCFLTVELSEFFIYVGYNYFIRYMIWKYFFLICGLSFHYFNSDFWIVNVFNFNSNLFFHGSWFDVLSKYLCLTQNHKGFLPMFSSRSVIILGFPFTEYIELIFVYEVSCELYIFCLY